jgi:hypothetical protein
MENKTLISSLFFKKALINILENNAGVIINVDKSIKPLYPGVDKVLIMKINNEIKIMNYDGDLDAGETVIID